MHQYIEADFFLPANGGFSFALDEALILRIADLTFVDRCACFAHFRGLRERADCRGGESG